MSIFLSFLLLSILTYVPIQIHAHARLVSPVPWNPQPSKLNTCGTSRAVSIPTKFAVSKINPAEPLTVRWVVQAGDGRGALTAMIDTTAKTNPTAADFAVQLISADTTPVIPTRVSKTPYRVTFTIPAGTVCTGVNDTCTLRVASSSAWVACATIQLSTTATTRPTTAATLPTDAAPTIPVYTTPTDDVTNPPPVIIDIPADEPATLPPPVVIIQPPTAAPTAAPIATAAPTPRATIPPPISTTASNGKGGILGARTAKSVSTGLSFITNVPTPPAGRVQGLLVLLHGSTASNYAQFVDRMATVATRYDLIRVSVLAPNGQGWNEGGGQKQLEAADLLHQTVQNEFLKMYNIDTSKIYFSGQSSGGGFLSSYFIPKYANQYSGGAFLQCGAAPPSPNVQPPFQPTARTIANFKLHFEITTGDTIWPQSYANALQAYTRLGMSYTSLNTKPGGHCQFDQQQVILDRITPMLPRTLTGQLITSSADSDDMDLSSTFTTLDASDTTTTQIQLFSAEPNTQTTCVQATGLTTCSKVNGAMVQLLTTSDLRTVDTNVLSLWSFELSDRSIFETTPSTSCRVAYLDLLCATHFPLCGATSINICQSTCRTAASVCTYNTTSLDNDGSTHAKLYDCNNIEYQATYADANGMCQGATTINDNGRPAQDSNGATTQCTSGYLYTLIIGMVIATLMNV